MVYSAKKWIYARAFDGEPKPEDFRLEEEVMPAIKDGGRLASVSTLFRISHKLFTFQSSLRRPNT